MRRIVLAAVLMGLLIWGSIWSCKSVQQTAENIAAAVEAGDLNGAWQQWDHAQTLLGALLMHDEIQEAERLLTRVYEADRKGLDNTLDEAELLSQLRGLPEHEKPSWKNLL